MAKGRTKGAPVRRDEDDASSSEEEEEERGGAARRVGKQASTAGLMPPSDSDSEEEELPKGQSATAGKLPPNPDDSESDEEAEEEDEDDDDAPPRCALLSAASFSPDASRSVDSRSRPEPVVEKSAAQVAAELAKLELIRKRRCVERLLWRPSSADCERRAEQAAARIEAEGYDRFAPKQKDDEQ